MSALYVEAVLALHNKSRAHLQQVWHSNSSTISCSWCSCTHGAQQVEEPEEAAYEDVLKMQVRSAAHAFPCLELQKHQHIALLPVPLWICERMLNRSSVLPQPRTHRG